MKKKLLFVFLIGIFGLVFTNNASAGRKAEKMERVVNNCAKIIEEFKEEISSEYLEDCKGLAIVSMSKAGLIISARGGSGVVIARDGKSWSAPSYIKMGGMGFGLQIGAQVTDFVLILNTQAALDAFASGGNVTLGGNLSVSAGPTGGTAEAGVAPTTAIFSYSKSKGAFAGISLEGTVLIEGKNENVDFYDKEVSAWSILNGEVTIPESVEKLHNSLKN